MTRRDKCYLVGRRAALLDGEQSTLAWHELAFALTEMSENDIPKFKDLLAAIRTATVMAKRQTAPEGANEDR